MRIRDSRRALLRKSRPQPGIFHEGEKVYFYRKRTSGKKTKALVSSAWVGPGVVLGHHGSKAWTAHRSQVVRVAVEQVRRASHEEARTWAELLADTELTRVLLEEAPPHLQEIDFQEPPDFAELEPIDDDEGEIIEGETDGQERFHAEQAAAAVPGAAVIEPP